MWKSSLFWFLLLASPFGVNATDYAARLSILGIDNVTELRLDLDLGTFSIAAHGYLLLEAGNASPLAGSCFINGEGGVACAITTSRNIFLYFSIDDSLNGPITE
jgi:hypothetical protein